jgi:sulfur relay (sulfurtransferase) DsrF/TusC family protein
MKSEKSLNIIGELNLQSLAILENKKEFRKKTKELCEEGKDFDFWYDEETLQKINPVKHTFMGGCYIRELFMPKDQLAVTKIHKQENVFFIMKGSFSLLTEDGVLLIEAPYHGLTKIGTQRIMYVHEDTVFITVHSIKKTTVKKAEEQIFAEDFSDPIITEEDLNILKNNI